MKREIKFRYWLQWDGHESVMVDWGEVYSYDSDGSVYLADALNGKEPGVTVMQYTGLHDKNGKEIYEGDIVMWGHLPGGEEFPIREAVVEISPDIKFRAVNHGENMVFKYGNFAYDKTEKWLEVIGNIYEHPELLNND